MIVRVLAVVAGLICVAVCLYALAPILLLGGVGAGLVGFGLLSDFDKAAS